MPELSEFVEFVVEKSGVRDSLLGIAICSKEEVVWLNAT